MMTAEQIAGLAALLAAATPRPWGLETVRTSCGVCHKIGPWPHKWRHGQDMSACIYDDYPSLPEGTDTMLSNAALIALAPDLAAEVLRLTATVADLTAANTALVTECARLKAREVEARDLVTAAKEWAPEREIRNAARAYLAGGAE